jgi:hypothetical protein
MECPESRVVGELVEGEKRHGDFRFSILDFRLGEFAMGRIYDLRLTIYDLRLKRDWRLMIEERLEIED